jgi:hypothetical protein
MRCQPRAADRVGLSSAQLRRIFCENGMALLGQVMEGKRLQSWKQQEGAVG